MAGKVSYGVPAAGLLVFLLGEGRVRALYENGERTDKQMMLNGKPVIRYPAAFSLDGGMSCAGVGNLDTTSELAPSAFGELFHGVGNGNATVSISPMSQYEVRLNVECESVVPFDLDEEGKR